MMKIEKGGGGKRMAEKIICVFLMQFSIDI